MVTRLCLFLFCASVCLACNSSRTSFYVASANDSSYVDFDRSIGWTNGQLGFWEDTTIYIVYNDTLHLASIKSQKEFAKYRVRPDSTFGYFFTVSRVDADHILVSTGDDPPYSLTLVNFKKQTYTRFNWDTFQLRRDGPQIRKDQIQEIKSWMFSQQPVNMRDTSLLTALNYFYRSPSQSKKFGIDQIPKLYRIYPKKKAELVFDSWDFPDSLIGGYSSNGPYACFDPKNQYQYVTLPYTSQIVRVGFDGSIKTFNPKYLYYPQNLPGTGNPKTKYGQDNLMGIISYWGEGKKGPIIKRSLDIPIDLDDTLAQKTTATIHAFSEGDEVTEYLLFSPEFPVARYLIGKYSYGIRLNPLKPNRLMIYRFDLSQKKKITEAEWNALLDEKRQRARKSDSPANYLPSLDKKLGSYSEVIVVPSRPCPACLEEAKKTYANKSLKPGYAVVFLAEEPYQKEGLRKAGLVNKPGVWIDSLGVHKKCLPSTSDFGLFRQKDGRFEKFRQIGSVNEVDSLLWYSTQ